MTILDGNERKLVNTIHKCTNFDIIIIGGGVAGLTAGIYAARDGFKTLILEGTVKSSTDFPGGALQLTNNIENFPGFITGEGSEIISIIRAQAEKFGATIKEERAAHLKVTKTIGENHKVFTENNMEYNGRAIIIATGAIARQLDIPGEKELYGQGVSTCATCDGFFFREKNVTVVGGGDTAVEDALLLTRYAKTVHLIVRGDKLKAAGPESREILSHPNITIEWETQVIEVIPNETFNHIEYLVLKDKNKSISHFKTDGLFVAIGSDPATQFLRSSIIMTDSLGYVKTVDNSTHVEGGIPGVFAAGDVTDRIFRQAITSSGKAVEAVLEARAYLLSSVAPKKKY